MRSIERPGASYGLPPRPALRYSPPVAAQSAAGRENPSYFKATQHAPGVFFYVVALVRSFFARWMLYYRSSQSMVTQAGQPSGWPVPLKAGFSPPSGLPPLRENFGGSNNLYFKEAATMATTLTPTHPTFCFLFAAVRRSALTASPRMVRTVADSEHNARRLLARDYVLSFAGRLPVKAAA
ncbi:MULTISPECIES: host cell division inhibitor Icd-like protein [Serratia]|uniref:host cell division inhibitor Icd-like protein n=1 Tax=Serratia TaxID=613 RepID=UPI0004E3916E|nr:host cell division inhibitor Icd-like protein [Serratia marcescens]KFD16439.1 phage immunity repressor protein [Serratia marcescens subsp. marcescens ATCC 13880]MCC3252217.1 host cell division inhibitor Icd-like protein [Serratia marcescens]PNU42654.1 Ash-like/host cell division inhibitor Icd-like protein [Serratia marcescens subsp. marcescens ATCC 13880]QDL84468.1 host cell division inhibitor Icd-like protein [Serratia marcescens subsp. marcescens ATCC 13880]QSO58299.1 host cell division i